MVEEFWKALRRGDFKQGRAIYQGELVPAFGDRMPDPIRLGVLLVESETGAAAADVLLQRLTELQRNAPALNRELVEKVRTAVTEGDKVRRLGQQLKAHQFDAAADAAEKSAWAGFPAGAMPVPVALALLVVRVKKEQTEQAEQLGSGIAGRPGLPVWARDYASLLLGRVLFSKKDYEAAANAFESVSSTNLLGHDTDRCWAAAQFSLGLQLLAVDQKDKAFKAFGKSLAKRGGRAENSKLAPLFIHFGLKNMEAKKGNRAKDSFQLMAQSLDGLPDSPEVTLNRLLADMGLLVCQALMDEEAKNLSGDKFRELRKRLETAGKLTITSGGRPAVVNAYLDRLFLILGVCQDLRRQVRLPTGERRKAAELYADLQPQVDALEKLRGEQEPHDPVVFTLKGCAALLWQTGPADDAMHWLEQAMALGAVAAAGPDAAPAARRGQEIPRAEGQGARPVRRLPRQRHDPERSEGRVHPPRRPRGALQAQPQLRPGRLRHRRRGHGGAGVRQPGAAPARVRRGRPRTRGPPGPEATRGGRPGEHRAADPRGEGDRGDRAEGADDPRHEDSRAEPRNRERLTVEPEPEMP